MTNVYERIAAKQAAANAKYDKYLGERITDCGGRTWAYAGCNDLEVFYWHKVARGRTQKKRFLHWNGDALMKRIIEREERKNEQECKCRLGG